MQHLRITFCYPEPWLLTQRSADLEITFTIAEIPRYCDTPFPAYRYLPFSGMPHPRYDPQGHSYGADEEYLASFCSDDWRSCQPYLYGVDLFNFGYWWEAHEAWEAVWHAAGKQTRAGNFVQGLIQISAAQLKRFMQEDRGAQTLTASGLAKLAVAEGVYLGIDVTSFSAMVESCLQQADHSYPRIQLS